MEGPAFWKMKLKIFYVTMLALARLICGQFGMDPNPVPDVTHFLNPVGSWAIVMGAAKDFVRSLARAKLATQSAEVVDQETEGINQLLKNLKESDYLEDYREQDFEHLDANLKEETMTALKYLEKFQTVEDPLRSMLKEIEPEYHLDLLTLLRLAKYVYKHDTEGSLEGNKLRELAYLIADEQLRNNGGEVNDLVQDKNLLYHLMDEELVLSLKGFQPVLAGDLAAAERDIPDIHKKVKKISDFGHIAEYVEEQLLTSTSSNAITNSRAVTTTDTPTKIMEIVLGHVSKTDDLLKELGSFALPSMVTKVKEVMNIKNYVMDKASKNPTLYEPRVLQLRIRYLLTLLNKRYLQTLRDEDNTFNLTAQKKKDIGYLLEALNHVAGQAYFEQVNTILIFEWE